MKNLIALVIAILIISTAVFFTNFTDATKATLKEKEQTNQTENPDMEEFVDCLAENEVVIFGSAFCGACQQFVESFGGYDVVDPIYVECSEGSADDIEKCQQEAETGYVPEIQIGGEVYEGSRDLVILGRQVGCEL